MDITLIERMANAACEIEAAREYLGTDDSVMALWGTLGDIQAQIESVIKAEAAR